MYFICHIYNIHNIVIFIIFNQSFTIQYTIMGKIDSKKEDLVTLSMYKFLCGHSNCKHICRLCLRFASKKTNLEEKIEIQVPYYHNKSVSYNSMLEDLNVQKEPLLPNILCENCEVLTINAYIFLKLRQYAVEKWNNSINILTNSLSHSDKIKSKHQTGYIMFNKTDNVLLLSGKKLSEKPKKIEVLKDFMNCCRKYIQQQKQVKDFQCNECNKSFNCYEYLVKHEKLHNRSPNPCTKCLKMFLTPTQLEEHMERVHYPKTVQCLNCSKKFGTQRIMKMHWKIHHTPATCKFCKIDFPSKLELRAHLDKHGAGTCQKCNKKFSSQNTYKLHLKSCGKKDNIKQKYICDICNKCYTTKNGIVSHLRIDHDFSKKVLTCKWCKKKFVAISRLKNHIVTHTKEKNFHCEQCGGQFVSQAALTYHIRLHTGEKPYPCDQCNESFLSSSRRMEHKRRKHIGPDKVCSLCEMRFLTQSQLRNHIKRHFNPSSKLYITDTDHYFPKRVRQPHLFT